jgi:hypothetical protein
VPPRRRHRPGAARPGAAPPGVARRGVAPGGSPAPATRPPAFRPARAPEGSDPLAGVEVVLIDGNNVLHALADPGRTAAAGGVPALPASAVIARLRAAIPPPVRIELHLDGPPPGIKGRVATGMTVEYSRRAKADDLILDRLARQLNDGGPASTWSILVVSDDRELRDAVAARGARTAGTAWLLRRLAGTDRPTQGRPGTVPVGRPKPGTGLGHGRPPREIRSSERDC